MILNKNNYKLVGDFFVEHSNKLFKNGKTEFKTVKELKGFLISNEDDYTRDDIKTIVDKLVLMIQETLKPWAMLSLKKINNDIEEWVDNEFVELAQTKNSTIKSAQIIDELPIQLFDVEGTFYCKDKLTNNLLIWDYKAEKELLQSFMLNPESPKTLGEAEGLISVAKAIAPAYRVDEVNPATKVPFSNGVFDLSTGQFEHMAKTEDLFTYELKVPFTPNKPLTEKATKYLQKLFENTDTLNHFMATLGVSLSTYTNDKSITFLYSSHEMNNANNGKSMLMKVVAAILGEDKVSNISLKRLSTNNFAAGGLEGKIINLADETDDAFSDADTIKTLSGQDYFLNEKKGKDAYKDRLLASLWFAANDIPQIGRLKDKEAIASRMNIIPLNAWFKKGQTEDDWKNRIFRPDYGQIVELCEDEESLSSIASCAVIIAHKYFDHGTYFRPQSQISKNLQEEYVDNNYISVANVWIESKPPLFMSIFGQNYDKNGRLDLAKAVEAFKEWCNTNDEAKKLKCHKARLTESLKASDIFLIKSSKNERTICLKKFM